ncbi:NAD-dependent epimerase/dehydratase family protein [uncultured Pseudokineococcus sp.]|uniref:NAD-dependent epimerase/dehydratase family protein n=1 Tax=uncultured Pseudokineococcus sp. TaxID=1642928 RepID=UPI0026145572|nr:NAD-dependent epimerase/dehydratase family protein [uncultured Pseudokineococcus sp.]
MSDLTSIAPVTTRPDPPRRAVVTGAAGFLGSHLVEELLSRGTEVVGLDSFLTGTPANLAHVVEHPGLRLVRCDITDYVHVPGDVDLVLHFASPASPVDYLKLPIETLKVGSIGTMHALGLAKDKGARFVLASTSEVYGDPQVHPQPEEYWGHVNPVGPRGVYDEAKRYAEALTTAYRTSHGVDTGIVRIFNTFGPRMRPHDGRAIPTFVRQALAGEPVTVAGDGLQTRSVCYVDDLVRGILLLASSGHAGPLNIGNPHELTVRRIAEDVIAATGSPSELAFVGRPVDDPQVRRPDTRLAAEALGWAPEVAWEDGLARTVAWFREALADGGTGPVAAGSRDGAGGVPAGAVPAGA